MNEKNERSVVSETAVVILAAGKSTRMGNAELPKVCFELDGVPAINRLIRTFKKQRFSKFLVVVGSRAERVMEVVSGEHPEVCFVFQGVQLGTGHAAKVAAESLQAGGHSGPVLVTMGDKMIEESAIKLLVEEFVRKQADLALLTIPKNKRTFVSGGRVFVNSQGKTLGIIERVDIARQEIADELKKKLRRAKGITPESLREILEQNIPQPKKRSMAVPDLFSLSKSKTNIPSGQIHKILDKAEYQIRFEGRDYSAEEIERLCKTVNPSLYLLRSVAFYAAVSMLDNENAQKEYYLTDIAGHLASYTDNDSKPIYRVFAVPVNDDRIIQGFNSPDELLSVHDYLRRKKKTDIVSAPQIQLKRKEYRTVSEWLRTLQEGSGSLGKWLNTVYGSHSELHEQKRNDLIATLKCYAHRFGAEEKVIIVRAPGRINLMGRHVDHRGGFNNFLAIDREALIVAGLRQDNYVYAVNTHPKSFKSVKFNISEMMGRFAWSDWVNFVNSDWVRQMLVTSSGDWGNYIKAAMLRLQHEYKDLQINGLNIALSGNIPMAAGLSSSSSIVVGTLQAAIALNGLEFTVQQFIDLCGTGEWFVGSRGGSGDHAAIYIGQRGKIANVGYLPFKVNEILDAPQDYQVLIANSHIKAAKSSYAKHAFNEKVCSYNLGLELLKLRCPEISGLIHCLRDVNPDHLGCSVSDVYRSLLKVPQFMTRGELRRAFPESYKELLDTNFTTHRAPSRYNIRGVLVFGIAEISRSRRCISLLKQGRIEEFGRLMKVSHDGDRVTAVDSQGKRNAFKDPYDNGYLESLISDLSSEDPERVLRGQLWMQPGSYHCSTSEIDEMVDMVNAVGGVAGVQVAGAGLGGCIMILAKKEAINEVKRVLVKGYYKPNKLKPVIIPCVPVEGAGLASF